MRLVPYFFLSLFFAHFKGLSQESASTEFYNVDFHQSMLDFVEVKNQELLVELDSIKVSSNSTIPITPEDIEILKRTKVLSKTIPLDYNDQVKFYIDKYISSNYRPYMNKMLGLSTHYFPIYESVFDEVGIPEEVKFLSLVESSLDPHLVSKSGAVGPWQFMYIAAKEFNLEMSSYMDERKDVYSASYAVSAYLNDAYSQFGDWLLAIASYNCGRGCVQRAIARSGFVQPTFWELAPFLPQETKNYIPKYLAMTYVLSDSEYYGIEPAVTELDLEHQVLMVDKPVDLGNVAQAIGLSNEELKKYNPAYKRNYVNGSVEKPKRLLLPKVSTLSDSLLYLALNDVEPALEKGANETERTYKVQKGETLASVSHKFSISVQNLKSWNGLNSKSSIVGKTLIIEKPIDDKLVGNVKATVASSKRSSKGLIYIVKKGDSLDRIANRYNGVTVSKLKADNGLKNNLIKPGMKLKINTGRG